MVKEAFEKWLEQQDAKEAAHTSVGLHESRAKKVSHLSQDLPDSMLACYKDRFTYTFILGSEVASIHFDRTKGEVYFRGRNVLNFNLLPEEKKALYAIFPALKRDKRGKSLLPAYEATLDKLLADKLSEGVFVHQAQKESE